MNMNMNMNMNEAGAGDGRLVAVARGGALLGGDRSDVRAALSAGDVCVAAAPRGAASRRLVVRLEKRRRPPVERRPPRVRAHLYSTVNCTILFVPPSSCCLPYLYMYSYGRYAYTCMHTYCTAHSTGTTRVLVF